MAVVEMDTDNRAQLLILAAIGLALLLVIMTLVLNTAVSGEIHVAQADESSAHERGAMQYQDSVERGVAGLIQSMNDSPEAYQDFEEGLENELDAWEELAASEYERDSVVTEVSLLNVRYENETRIIHDDPDFNFTDAQLTRNWTVAAEVTTVRTFQMNVTDGELVDTSECSSGDECFTLTVEGGDGEMWSLEIFENDGIVLRDSEEGTDSTDSRTLSLNLTAGTCAETDCEFTSFTDYLEPPYNISYTNGHNSNGTYELVVTDTIEDDERYSDDGSPRLEEEIVGIESAEVAIRYQSVVLNYETERWIAPGDTNG